MTGSALVLGGGGVTGVAWELGILHGLADAGADLTTADVVVGTSAGSVVAVQITTVPSLGELYERQIAGYGGEIASRVGLGSLLKLALATMSTRDERKALARVGAMALAARTIPEAERRAVIDNRLPVHDWPDRDVRITAVAADTGEFVVFDRSSGVSIVDAVAASCAVPGVWPPATVNGRRFIDGGIRSPANVDVARGYDRVVVLAPTTVSLRRRLSPAAQLAALPATTRTLLVSPDRTARTAIGSNPLDPAHRAPAAKAGRRQSESILDAVDRVWSAQRGV